MPNKISGSRRALVLSYSEVSKDPRVRNQIQWLVGAGYRVDLIGRGKIPTSLNGNYLQIKRWWLPIRLFSYLFLSNQYQYKLLIDFWFPIKQTSAEKYDLIILNTLDFLPWVTSKTYMNNKKGSTLILDLHEYSPSQGTGFLWKLLFRRYQNWLIQMISNPIIDKRITVAPGIASLYASNLGINKPEIIMNVPQYENLKPSETIPNEIKLVHHGKADNARGLPLLIEAMSKIDSRFSLTFMLVGPQQEISQLKSEVEKLQLTERVFFMPPVKLEEVAKALNQFDAEIIFIPPVTLNYKYVLPNKYFEAVQGRLAIISGQSEEIIRISSKFKNAVITDSDWKVNSLVSTINSLDSKIIDTLKIGSDNAAKELSAEAEGIKFLNFISN